ncbi:MAG: DUF1080 domain-containing protein [Opitutaceae bacterium]|jgi:hypothetical protein
MSSALRILIPFLAAAASLLASENAFYGAAPDDSHPWCVHDRNRPLPVAVTPGETASQPPSDAVVLFDGTSLDAWENEKDNKPVPARWEIVNGALRVVPKTGMLRTKRQFGDCQLHIEWATPKDVTGQSQGRGNSGVFFMGGRYEVQVLDCYQNTTYSDGYAGAIYAQNPPLVNATRPSGVWQTYDIVFHTPRFDQKGAVTDRGSITVFLNGVLIQDHWLFEGRTDWKVRAKFSPHAPVGPIELQDHGNPTQFRNIWVRELAPVHTATPAEAAAQRKATSAKLLAEASKAASPIDSLLLKMESLIYVSDKNVLAAAADQAAKLIAGYRVLDRHALPAKAGELRTLRNAFNYMSNAKLAPANAFPASSIEELMKCAGIELP